MAIDARPKEDNYTSFIINTNHSSEEKLHNLEGLSRMNVDGIILNATNVSEQHVEITKRLDIPVVFVAQECKECISIINEDYVAGYYMGEYCALSGHRDIVCMSVDEQDVAIGVTRKHGILDGLHNQGIDQVEVIVGDFSLSYSYEQLKKVLDIRVPDIIICSTTKQLLAAYKIVREKGLIIPQDISIVGFGGLETSEMLVPKATTIQFNPTLTGQCSADAMLSILKREVVQHIQHVPFTFVEGESVKRKDR